MAIKNEWLTLGERELKATDIKNKVLYCSEEFEEFLLEIRNQGT